jgi:hypothetical protein
VLVIHLALRGDALKKAMGTPVPIRDDIPAEEPRCLAPPGDQRPAGRPAARLGHALDGMSRAQAACQAGMNRYTVHDRVLQFNAEWGSTVCEISPRAGTRGWLSEGQLAALKALVLRGTDRECDDVSTYERFKLAELPTLGFAWGRHRCGWLSRLSPALQKTQRPAPLSP